MANKTQPKTIGDILLAHISDEYNFSSGTLKMPASGTPHNVPQVAGMPGVWNNSTKVLTLSLNAAIGDATALVVAGPALSAQANDAATTVKYTILTNFNGVVLNKNGIPLVDSAGTTITLATLVTALETLGAKVIIDPAKKTTQTT
jgi:hypothetical protein